MGNVCCREDIVLETERRFARDMTYTTWRLVVWHVNRFIASNWASLSAPPTPLPLNALHVRPVGHQWGGGQSTVRLLTPVSCLLSPKKGSVSVPRLRVSEHLRPLWKWIPRKCLPSVPLHPAQNKCLQSLWPKSLWPKSSLARDWHQKHTRKKHFAVTYHSNIGVKANKSPAIFGHGSTRELTIREDCECLQL